MSDDNSSNNNNNRINYDVEWRRDKVQELLSKGYKPMQISRMLQIPQPTISRDLAYLRQRRIYERLAEEYEECGDGIKTLLKEAWGLYQQMDINKEKDKYEKLHALMLIKEVLWIRADMLTNAAAVSVNDAISCIAS